MIKYILRRLLLIIPVLLGAIIVVFTINFFSTTDPAMIKLGLSASDPYKLAAMRETMGLNRPYIVQLADYIWNLCHGDLGDSYVYSKTVWELLAGRIPNTLKLGLGAMVISVCIGIPLGILAALHQNSAVDYITTTFAVVMNAMPGFLVAVLLMIVFALKLGWFPVSGADGFKSFVLPVIAAGIGPITQNARMTRSSVLEVIRQDYVRTARAKGLLERTIRNRFVLRNAMLPVTTTIGLQTGLLISGAVLTETVFAFSGVGRFLRDAIFNLDYPVLQGFIIFIAVAYSLINLLVDVSYGFIDPRVRVQ